MTTEEASLLATKLNEVKGEELRYIVEKILEGYFKHWTSNRPVGFSRIKPDDVDHVIDDETFTRLMYHTAFVIEEECEDGMHFLFECAWLMNLGITMTPWKHWSFDGDKKHFEKFFEKTLYAYLRSSNVNYNYEQSVPA